MLFKSLFWHIAIKPTFVVYQIFGPFLGLHHTDRNIMEKMMMVLYCRACFYYILVNFLFCWICFISLESLVFVFAYIWLVYCNVTLGCFAFFTSHIWGLHCNSKTNILADFVELKVNIFSVSSRRSSMN